MRYKQFLIQEGRSQGLSQEKAFSLIKKNCQKSYTAYMDNKIIYRGVRSGTDEYAYIDPKKHVRTSANTQNYYTWMIDACKLWKKYPKRSESIICTNSYKKASAYGTCYEVFPYDGATIGIAPTHDFWFSFENSLGHNNSLNYFNFSLEKIIKNGIDLDTIRDAKYLIQVINDAGKTMVEEEEEYGIDTRNLILRDWNPKQPLFEHIMFNLLSPKKNHFEYTTSMSGIPSKHYGKGQELWTDSKCVMLVSHFGGAGGINQDLDRYMDTGKIGMTNDEYRDFLRK